MIKYFAYGSNMLVAKLRSQKRCPTAEKIEPSKGSQHLIRNHTFKFHKRSKDLSAKGDAEATNDDNDIVYGVLFSINDEHELKKLEREEGVKAGYYKKNVDVIDEETGDETTAITFCAEQAHIPGGYWYEKTLAKSRQDSNLLPYHWYKRQTVQGAIDNRLPDHYIKKLESFEFEEDDYADGWEKRRKEEESYFTPRN